MKRFLLLFLAFSLSPLGSLSFGQITQFPYNEGFENQTFVQGTDVYFIDNWFGNFVDGIRIFQEDSNTHNGMAALGLWPASEEGEEEELEIIVQVDLNLRGMENVVTKFWLATESTGDMKHVKLYVKLSLDGGETFGPKLIMGSDPRGFENVDMPYQEFVYPLHPYASKSSDVVLQFVAKAGARKGNPAKVLIDDVYIYEAPEDIFPPQIFEPKITNEHKISIQFSEPVDPETALDMSNYTFLNGPVIPEVTMIALTKPDMVTLGLYPGISIGHYQDLEIANIEDFSGNTMEDTIAELIYNPLTEGLVITEIMYDEPPVGKKDDLEFIELKNITKKTIELGGLRIKGAIASGKLPEYSLGPAKFLILAKDAELFTGFFGVPAIQWHGGNLSNDESEKIFIQNTDHHSGVEIDAVTYGVGPPWPAGAAGLGYSMELIDPLADNNDPANWREPTYYCGQYKGFNIYATPGMGPVDVNSKKASLKNAITIHPNPVHDELYLTTPEIVTRVEIYNFFGERIVSLTNGEKIIDTSFLSKGIYLVKIFTDKEASTVRIIKN